MTSLPTLGRVEHKIDGVAVAGVIALAVVSAALAVAGDGTLASAVGPLIGGVILILPCTLPLRVTLLVLAFLVLTLETPSEAPAAGKWRSPLYNVGALLLMKLNDTLPVK